METRKRTPMELFNLPQHFVIPLFQRPYVWEEEDQWVPLWKDVRRTVERRMSMPHERASHFLGAVVLQASDAAPGNFNAWNVIDGQQRLTTLQLLMDAAQAVFEDAGFDRLASKLNALTHNADHYVRDDEQKLKIRHLNKDRAAFDEVMNADAPVDYHDLAHGSSRLARAHKFFTSSLQDWLGEPEHADFTHKAEILADTLETGLQLVSIDLTPDEDSQEIFETLNARGTPLTAADLVRNFVFQRLEAEGADSKEAYEKHWPFENKFWEKDVNVGRQVISRSSLFLNQWLTSKLGEEISPHNTFTTFKSFVEHRFDGRIRKLLPLLKQQADQYQAWTEAASQPDGNLNPVEMAVYRMNASRIEILKPILIWLTDPEKAYPDDVIAQTVRAMESWIYRRQLLRLPTSDAGRIVSEIIRTYSDAKPLDLAPRVIAHLTRLRVTSTYWPGDDEVRSELLQETAYNRYPRARLRMFLEAIENAFRAETRQPQVQRGWLPIEHVLPQKWQDFWPVDNEEEELNRIAHVHRWGNLTLLTASLNSKVKNGPWTEKRKALMRHNTMTMTGRLIERDQWSEDSIQERSLEMIDTLLTEWPVPEGHAGEVADPSSRLPDWIEIKHLVNSQLLAPGDKLVPRHRDWTNASGVDAFVTKEGRISVNGRLFESPSAAGHALTRRSTNGWKFWALADGRRLSDVRDEFMSLASNKAASATPEPPVG